jgi:hypothetical protein
MIKPAVTAIGLLVGAMTSAGAAECYVEVWWRWPASLCVQPTRHDHLLPDRAVRAGRTLTRRHREPSQSLKIGAGPQSFDISFRPLTAGMILDTSTAVS